FARTLTGGAEFAQLKTQVGWVQSLYQDILGRLPAMSEWLYYAQLIRNGTARTAVAGNFLVSPERESEYVSYLYNSILGRDPSAAEVNFYVPQLQGGTRQESLEGNFFASPEFFARAGGTNAGYVTALYKQELGRAPSAAE